MNETLRLDLRDPARVVHHGHDYGGPLKLHARTDADNALPVAGEFIVIKWPAYTQWAAVGERESNPTEYWLVEVLEEPTGKALTWRCERRKVIQPGRKRSLVKALVEEAKALYAEAV